jgi:hypothetical protein
MIIGAMINMFSKKTRILMNASKTEFKTFLSVSPPNLSISGKEFFSLVLHGHMRALKKISERLNDNNPGTTGELNEIKHAFYPLCHTLGLVTLSDMLKQRNQDNDNYCFKSDLKELRRYYKVYSRIINEKALK